MRRSQIPGTVFWFIGFALVGGVGTALLAEQQHAGQQPLRVLNFQADNGFQYQSKSVALQMVERIGRKNGWEVVTTTDSASLNELDLSTFDTVVFNNNCGNKGPVMKPAEQFAFQKYIQNDGGFPGVRTPAQ